MPFTQQDSVLEQEYPYGIEISKVRDDSHCIYVWTVQCIYPLK